MDILDFNTATHAFTVRYIPDDLSLSTHIYTTHIDVVDGLENTPVSQERILSILAEQSPQFYWQQEKNAKETDISHLKELVNTNHNSEDVIKYLDNIKNTPLISNDNRQNLSQSEIDQFINSILDEQPK